MKTIIDQLILKQKSHQFEEFFRMVLVLSKMRGSLIYFIILFTLILIPSCLDDTELPEINRNYLIQKVKTNAIRFKNEVPVDNFQNNLLKSGYNSEPIISELLSSCVELIKSYDISDYELISEVGSLQNTSLISIGLAIIQIEDMALKGIELIDHADGTSLLTGNQILLSTLTYLKSNNSLTYDCALRSLGITAVGELIKNGIKNMSKSAVKKVIRKIAVRYLPYAGVAIALYEFTDCMGWF
jgi:hypothetical protein